MTEKTSATPVTSFIFTSHFEADTSRPAPGGFEILLIRSDSNQGTRTIFILPGVTKEHERLWF